MLVPNHYGDSNGMKQGMRRNTTQIKTTTQKNNEWRGSNKEEGMKA